MIPGKCTCCSNIQDLFQLLSLHIVYYSAVFFINYHVRKVRKKPGREKKNLSQRRYTATNFER